MARQYSLGHLTVLGCPPSEAVHVAARCGYDFIGLRSIPLGLPGEPRYVFEDDPAMFRATRAALGETGVRLLDVEVALIAEDRRVATYAGAMERAAELGAQHVLCNAWSGEPSFIQAQFEELCDLAAPLSLTVQCEFVTFTKIRGLSDAWRLVQASGRANAGVLIDTLHFERSRVMVQEIEAVPRDRFHYLQLCDAPFAEAPTVDDMRRTARSERLYPGEGVSPIREIVARLPCLPLALEITHAARIQALGYEGFARKCLDRTRAWLGEV
jgi:sugar phosphate isomerase/epimerase